MQMYGRECMGCLTASKTPRLMALDDRDKIYYMKNVASWASRQPCQEPLLTSCQTRTPQNQGAQDRGTRKRPPGNAQMDIVISGREGKFGLLPIQHVQLLVHLTFSQAESACPL